MTFVYVIKYILYRALKIRTVRPKSVRLLTLSYRQTCFLSWATYMLLTRDHVLSREFSR